MIEKIIIYLGLGIIALIGFAAIKTGSNYDKECMQSFENCNKNCENCRDKGQC